MTFGPLAACGRFLLWCWFLLAPMALHAQTVMLDAADVEIRIGASMFAEHAALPYRWDQKHAGASGQAEFNLPFALERAPEGLFGLFIPKASNAYEIRLNGMLLERHGDLEASNTDDAKLPHLITVVPGLLRTSNLLQVRIRADAQRRSALLPMTLAPYDQAQQIFSSAWHWRVTGLVAVVAFSMVIGVLGLCLWGTQAGAAVDLAQRKWLYLYTGLAELLWTLRVGDSLIESPPIPWPWWGMVPVLALGGWACFTCLFCAELVGWSDSTGMRWLRRWMLALMLGGGLASLGSFIGGIGLALTLWYAAIGLTFLVFGVLFVRRVCAPTASFQSRIVAAALVLNLVVGLGDLYLLRIRPGQQEVSSMYYASVLFGIAAAVVIVLRYRRAALQARASQTHLQAMVTQKEQELLSSYQHLLRIANEKERLAERGRILRDMHDGVGAHINVALRQLDSAGTDRQQVVKTLRESLDHLKLSIDSMSLPAGDITALLAGLRYRLEPRLQVSGIQLQWDVDLISDLSHIDDAAMRHIQFMVYEAISNVLQHAGATLVRIMAHLHAGDLHLRVVDNGSGFDPVSLSHKGLRSIRDRAQHIGAAVHVNSRPGETVLEIVIPAP